MEIASIMELMKDQSTSQGYQPIALLGKVVKIIPEEQLYRVQYQGSEWKARPARPIKLRVNQLVRVVEINNITLLVEPL